VIVETLRDGLNPESAEELTEAERVRRVLRESGLWEPLGPEWKKYIKDRPRMTHAELRERLKGISPLSETIIEGRERR
jgi:hypothetical protein